MSKDSLVQHAESSGRPQRITDQIFRAIKEMAKGQKTLKIATVKEQCTSKGYTPDQIDECIEEYEEINVFSVNQTKTKITFID